MGIHITEKAKNTKIDNCEFINTGIKDEGTNTKIINSKFIKTLHEIKSWSQRWWGQLILTVGAGLILYYIFGIK